MPPSRLRVLSLVVTAALTTPTVARAYTYQGTLQLTVKKRLVAGDGTVSYGAFSATELLEFFNRANCQCGSLFGLELKMTVSDANIPNHIVEVWAGSDCSNVSSSTTPRGDRCHELLEFSAQELKDATRPKTIDVRADQVMFNSSGSCGSTGASGLFALISENQNGTYDHIWPTPALQVAFTALPPTQVTAGATQGVEDGVMVSWTIPSSTTGIRSYQILCKRDNGTPVLSSPPQAQYRRQPDICPGGAVPIVDGGVGTIDAGAGAPDAQPPAPDAGTGGSYEEMDPRFVCSDEIGNTGTSVRISLAGLNLAATDKVTTQVVTIDTARNPSAPVPAGSAAPQPVKDGWEVYKDEGGQADGGFCFVATAAYGDYDHPYVRILRSFRDRTLAHSALGRAFIGWYYRSSPPLAAFLRRHPVLRFTAAVALFPVVVAAALWDETSLLEKIAFAVIVTGLLVIRRRRRLRRRAVKPGLGAGAGLALVLGLLPGRAAAQPVLMDDATYADETPGPRAPNWAFELKLGPYYPAIDDETSLGGNQPYHLMFGDGSSLLPVIELDRFFLHPHGQLGVAVSLGYMSNTANSFIQNTDGTRSDARSADETTFHLIPFAVSAVYRYTDLAEKTVVPLVPYVKLGLSYYVWWITKGDGSISSVAGNDAQGGTLGWQFSVGLSLRADRFDPDAARSVQSELGVEHIGFFAELTAAQVGGLVFDHKLNVGDLTWSAGLNFEF